MSSGLLVYKKRRTNDTEYQTASKNRCKVCGNYGKELQNNN